MGTADWLSELQYYHKGHKKQEEKRQNFSRKKLRTQSNLPFQLASHTEISLAKLMRTLIHFF
jgi:hypothetical protein